MPRSLSSTILQFARTDSFSESAVDITLANGQLLRLATVDAVINGQTYERRIDRVGSLQQSLTRSADRVKLTLNNVDLQMGRMVADARRLFDFAPVQLYRLYAGRDENPPNWQRAQFFTGRVSAPTVTESPAVVTLDLVTDLVAAGTATASDVYSAGCNFRYKDPSTCGYTGALTTCNKIYDSADGCLGRNNQARFGGCAFPFPDATTSPTGGSEGPVGTGGGGGTGGGTGGGGGGGGGGSCFVKGTPIRMWDRTEKPIEEIEVGDLVLSFDSRTQQLHAGRVERLFRAESREQQYLDFDDGAALRVTGEHPFFTGDRFRKAKDLRRRMLVMTLAADGHDWAPRRRVVSNVRVRTAAVTVYNFHVAPWQTYFADSCAVHNLKSPYENLLQ